MAAREDILFATGRSDYPNRSITYSDSRTFSAERSTCGATKDLNEEMKIAAVRALAALTKEPVPDIVAAAYNDNNISFGRGIPDPQGALDRG